MLCKVSYFCAMLEMQKIKISEFNYDLPDQKIAKFPLENRDDSNLLYYKDSEIKDYSFSNLPELLDSNVRLIFNNTKVIRARLHFEKITGAKIEIFCLEPHLPAEYVQSFESNISCQWSCMIGNAKKWKETDLIKSITIAGDEINIRAKKINTDKSSPIIEFSWDNTNYTFSEIIEGMGQLPIPPYLNRKTEASDLVRYQTVYSKIKGSVAAPTAGLHFTDKVFQNLQKKNIAFEEVTLHVGAGTFKPVKSEVIGEHAMHTEHFIVQKSTLENLLDDRKNIPVGTTSVRTLESLYWLAVKIDKGIITDKLHVNQWDPYKIESNLNKNEALQKLIDFLEEKNLDFIEASTEIMIVPGYKFRITDSIITNFHQPKSTLLLLISAFVGEEWKTMYQHALNNNYRFLSYGDSSLLMKNL